MKRLLVFILSIFLYSFCAFPQEGGNPFGKDPFQGNPNDWDKHKGPSIDRFTTDYFWDYALNSQLGYYIGDYFVSTSISDQIYDAICLEYNTRSKESYFKTSIKFNTIYLQYAFKSFDFEIEPEYKIPTLYAFKNINLGKFGVFNFTVITSDTSVYRTDDLNFDSIGFSYSYEFWKFKRWPRIQFNTGFLYSFGEIKKENAIVSQFNFYSLTGYISAQVSKKIDIFTPFISFYFESEMHKNKYEYYMKDSKDEMAPKGADSKFLNPFENTLIYAIDFGTRLQINDNANILYSIFYDFPDEYHFQRIWVSIKF